MAAAILVDGRAGGDRLEGDDGLLQAAGRPAVQSTVDEDTGTLEPAETLPANASVLDDVDGNTSLEPFLQGLGNWGMTPGVSAVVFMILVMCGLAAVFAVAQYVFIRASRMLGARMITDMRQDLAEHLVSLGMGFHGERRLGDLMSRLTVDVNTSLRVMTLMVEEMLQSPFSILAALAVAYAAEPTATLGMLLFLPLLAIPIVVIGPKVRRRAKGAQDSLGDTTQSLLQMLSGIRVVKAFRMEEREAQEFRAGNDEFVKSHPADGARAGHQPRGDLLLRERRHRPGAGDPGADPHDGDADLRLASAR